MDVSFFAGVALVVVGLIEAFFGYRLFRILLPIIGGVAGFLLAWGWWGDSQWLLALVVGAALAVVLALLAYSVWSVFVGVAGVVFGLAFASLIATTLNLWTWLAIVLAVVCAFAFGALFFVIRNEMVIVATALTGAASVARGIGEWFGLRGRAEAAANPNPTWLTLLIVAIFIAVALLGIWFQWGRYRRLNLYGAQGKAPAPAQPATSRTSSIPVSSSPASPVQPLASVTSSAAAPAAATAGGGAVAVAGVAAVGASLAGHRADQVEAGDVAAEAVVADTQVVEAADDTMEETGDAVSATEEPVVEAPVAATAALVEVTEAPGEVPVEIADVPAEAPNEIGDAVAEVVSGAEEMAADALAETGAQAAVLGAVVANKVAEAVRSEALDEVAGAADDSGNVNILDAVVKEIQETYSLQDIAKFKEKLEFVEGIGPAFAAKLNAVGINTVLDLLQRGATRKGRLDLAEATGIAGKLILKWVNHADLYRIKGVGSEYADLLEAAGVDTVVELAHRNPANLLNTVLETNKVRSLVRKEPVASQLEDWVTQAKELPRIIQY